MKVLSDTFHTGVRASDGYWPGPPVTWTYSSLREVGQCPRRWMLSRATYPNLWSGLGYPPRPTVATLVGDIVHGVLEFLVRRARESGYASLADPAVVELLRELGGYTRLVEDGMERRLGYFTDNPRMADHIGPLQAALRARIPDMRQQVQVLVARNRHILVTPTGVGEGSPVGPLSYGAHAELEIRAPALRLAGRVDLIVVDESGCEITDYKTGAPEDYHVNQLWFYSLIWSRDGEHNPRALPVRRLTLSYSTHDVEVAPLDAPALEAFAVATSKAIEVAESALRQRPPPAYPRAEICRSCGVRQLCEDYWATKGDLAGPPGGLFDFEGTVVERNGSRSWLLAKTTEPVLLLRTPGETVTFGIGDRVRLLGLRREEDEEVSLPVAMLTSASEVFLLTNVS